MRGVLCDQPDVLERARGRGYLTGEVADSVQLQAGDFFQAVPKGCRAYLMKNILHDWDNDRARRILTNCRGAVPDDGVLLVVEYAVGGQNKPTLGKAIDLAMLAITGGRERTVDEHSQLLASAGFRISRAIQIRDEVVILEAVPVSVHAEQREYLGKVMVRL
jgi:hypothetical protein